jgi:hypothetical protein
VAELNYYVGAPVIVIILRLNATVELVATLLRIRNILGSYLSEPDILSDVFEKLLCLLCFLFGGENDNRLDHGEIGWGGMDWIHLAPDGDQWRALMNTVMSFFVS